ncbi:protein-L-isoaspartate(D-aspartate) O-methyltransferase [Pontiella sulfatireligans]|uniref:Protein-L-isoaspartate O-methyltransferase n=1 Tax=Pontiella sulfatireligans TaxID=2750658 RepID=A0A6C2UK44_9BACT|nr:protein-L-isoaspartate(D-aspartate) O-methyltransferase [Pontiella sulfatireligans]VGO20602.1 Protein-L-isoaspartate O-methyltransferase [Pontiella sulfatireligans]
MDVQRKMMVAVLKQQGVKDGRVIEAMGKVRRHVYIPEALRGRDPYGDHPCPIGHGQTISQPFIVAYMTQRIEVKPGMRILEIGTGSGYQAAVLAELGAKVYSIEIIPELSDHARAVLAAEGYKTVEVKTGDGYKGWPEHALFDAVIVTCAPDKIPKELVKQLKDGGRMILPVGTGIQQLVILEKTGDTFREIPDMHVRFVPMVKGNDD